MTNVRNFTQGQYITGSIGTGGLATLLSGPFTIAAIVRRSDSSFNDFGPIFNLAAGANGSRGMFRYTDNSAPANSLNYIRGQFQSPGNGPSWTSSDAWCMVAMTKAGGTAAVDYYKRPESTGTLSHVTSSGTVETDGTTCTLWNTRYQSDNDWVFRGRYAVLAAWNTKLTQAELLQLVSFYSDWVSSSPIGLWRFDQASTATPVLDQTGNGADQSALVGSTVVDDPDLLFSFTDPSPPAQGSIAPAVGVDLAVSGSSPAQGSIGPAVGVDLVVTGARSAQGLIAPAVGAELEVTGARSAQGLIAPAVGAELEVTGARSAQGSVVPAVGVELEVTGARPAQGSVAPAVGVELEVTGSSTGAPAFGVVAPAVGVELEVVGARPAQGSVVVVVGVQLTVTGQGSAGRPVHPFPWPPEPVPQPAWMPELVSGFPWLPRPVRSFSQVPVP